MSEFVRYIAEEIALDHAEGLMDRREALHRLALLGITGAAGAALLAACSSGSSPAAPAGSAGAGAALVSTPAAGSPASSGSAQTSPPPGSSTALQTTDITFAGPSGRTLRGAWATAPTPRGAVLVIHENRGLTPHIASIAGRLAGVGYSALAIDLLSEEGGTGALTAQGAATAALANAPDSRLIADLRAGISELARRAPGHKLGVTGFCFGGGLTWMLLSSGENRLSAAVPFYGPLPPNPTFTAAKKTAVLAFYGGDDTRVTGTRDAAAAALNSAGLVHNMVTFPGAGHAFFNDTGTRYNPEAASSAFQQLTNWFRRYLT